MISKHKYKTLTWVDVEKPTRDEIALLAEEYEIPELVSEELLLPAIRSKVDRHENSIFMILHFPIMKHKTTIQEIDFFVGKNFLITVHYEPIKALKEFSKLFESHDTTLDRQDLEKNAGSLFYVLMKEFYLHSINELSEISIELQYIQKNIFTSHEKEMVRYILEINRQLLDFKLAMQFHKEVLKSFEVASRGFFSSTFEFHISVILGEYNKVENMLAGQREILYELRTTNDSLLANQTNETMKILTIITFLITPITVISSIFMMNTSFSLIETTDEFYFILGAMLLTSIATFIYFKMKKWL